MKKWILVDRTAAGGASGIAMKRLCAALGGAGIEYERVISWTGALPERIVIAAPNTDATVRNLLRKNPLTAPESIQLAAAGGARLISGSDERGLAYALMEVAERVEADGEQALSGLSCEESSPTVAVRGVDRIISNTADCEWWMSEDYWRSYLEGMLAARFNRLVLLVGFDTSYLSPAYPFFVDVPEYPGVRLIGGKVERGAHLAALRRLGALAHEYGMEFVFATWQQTLWLPNQVSMVEGIDDLTGYCAAGICEFVLQCPEIDVIQLRVNHEAGVGTQVTAEEFWFRQLDGLARAVARGRRIKLDMRAKGLTDPMIRYAKELGLDLTVSTKYWCEQAGLPHHLTRMRTEELDRLDNFNHSRRYSYSDMLKKPRLHKFMYRLWNDGSTDLFTWGDPDYVRRFVASMALGRADGFEIMPPLSLKGGSEDYLYAGWKLFDDPAYQPEGYEDARYWLCNRLFGRISYDAGAADEVWMRPMRQKFGAAADPLMACVAAGSKLIPFIVGYHMPVHPQLAYWAEFSTGGALFAEHNHNPSIRRVGVTYQNTEPGDAGLFYPADEYARDSLTGREDGRYTPWQVAAWLSGISGNIRRALECAERVGVPETPEARGLVLDMRMLSEFALYHRAKIAAGTYLSFYQETKDAAYLRASLGFMRDAREKWAAFATLGEKYHRRLVFFVGNGGPARDGNWKDFLPELDADLKKLGEMLADASADTDTEAADTDTGVASTVADTGAIAGVKINAAANSIPDANVAPLVWRDDVPPAWKVGAALPVTLRTGPQDRLRGGVRLRYRHTNQMEGKFLSAAMEYRDGVWRAEIPADYVVPEWDLLVYFEATAPNGDGMNFPGLWHPQRPLPYQIVEVES
ncbi:MAG: hypothetical protein LBU58_02165 [Clostridiales bacterium]|jgi:hypothetical protein|nr:hypothetical protein [Clostridiales bacterium]